MENKPHNTHKKPTQHAKTDRKIRRFTLAHDARNDHMPTGVFKAVRKPERRTSPKAVLRANARKITLTSKLLVGFMCALLGFGYLVQVHNTTSAYDSLSEDELTRLLSESTIQSQNLENRKSQLARQLKTLQNTANKQQEARRIAEQNKQVAGLLAGQLPAQGQGVIIHISQGIKTAIDATTIFQLIEELRNAGVEVMAINQVRIVTSTYVADTKEGLEADGFLLEPPYIIKAIGNPQNLQNAVNIAGGVGSKLKTKFGATVNVTTSPLVVIDELHSSNNDTTYTKPLQ